MAFLKFLKSPFLRYLLQRIGQCIFVIFIGVTVTFIVPRLSPINPVERKIAQIMATGTTLHPEAMEKFREALTEMYGLKGSMMEQYLAFWGRFLRGDMGPSLSAFPTPVSELIGRSMPWTIGLLLSTGLIAWLLGNLLGGIAGYHSNSRFMNWVELGATCVRPIPYYIFAFILLVLFCYLVRLFPTEGGYARGLKEAWNIRFMISVLYHTFLPGLSLIIVGVGGWLLGMRSLVSNIISEDYIVYAEVGGVKKNTILYKYVMRNALLPQITGLGLSLGQIFSGALITEYVFGLPGIGQLAYIAITESDYSLIMGISIFSILGVSISVLILDLLYPFFDPRIRLR